MEIPLELSCPPWARHLRFGECDRCPHLEIAIPETCYRCAAVHAPRLSAKRCAICDDRLEPGARCLRPLCRVSEQARGWRAIWAIQSHAGPVRSAIEQYKYRGDLRWARVFAAMLVGHLDAHADDFGGYDLLISSPTHVGPEGARLDHTQFVLEQARLLSQRWPIGRNVIRKVDPTPRFAGLPFRQRASIAGDQLRRSLHVTNPSTVAGKRVLVYDDVFTCGLTLREVAFALKSAGAAEVSGIVIARRPFVGAGSAG